ncbi:MAG: hypothetical protein KGY80_07675 [Candidatus Thorarchaeota archaeon]|nr:hypothetical protein [Candidatus Thorarchaeota archaeon]
MPPSSAVPVSRLNTELPGGAAINLANLLLRNSDRRVTTVQVSKHVEADPEVYVVTRVNWAHKGSNEPLLVKLPSLLSVLETLRGSRSVPERVDLESEKGLVVYIPTALHISELSNNRKRAVKHLLGLAEETVAIFKDTKETVERWFWKAARQRGFGPKIVERIAAQEPGYYTPDRANRFQDLLRRYFSVKFTIHHSQGCLRVEREK